jgi:hypothetical protein
MVCPSAIDKAKKEENNQLAIEHYHKTGETSIRTSAAEYNVPFTTRRGRFTGRRSHQESHQNQQVLIFNNEELIVKWIHQMDDWGFPLKITVVNLRDERP